MDLVFELVKYLLTFIIIAACAVGGIFVGKTLRKNKNAKLAAAVADDSNDK